MFDLNTIKERRVALNETDMKYWRFVASAPADIDALIAEVERLREVLHETALSPYVDSDPLSLLATLRHRARNVLGLQPCGHPESAIVCSVDDMGGKIGTCYCKMCVEENKNE